MLFLLDIGNTSLKWAAWKGGRLADTGMAVHRTASMTAVADANWRNREQPRHVLAASVAGARVAHELTSWVDRNWHVPLTFLRARDQAFGVRNAYRDAQRLGVDRWLALIAAHRFFPGSCCIVDCGTAITIDAIDGQGRHLGGMIVPGLWMMREALARRTWAIESAEVEPRQALARDTESAVANGSLCAAVGGVEHAFAAARARVGSPLRLLLTGSDAPRLSENLSLEVTVDPHLVLRGLAVFTEELG
jgi:type III pantothenate kinase